jgi:hypothetical protein
MLHIITATGTGVGTDASATFTTYTDAIRGKILWIDVVYEATVPAPESDVTISDNLGSDTAILTLTNKVADGRFYPTALVQDTVGVDIAAQYTQHYVVGPLKIVGAQLDEDDVINFVICYED